MINTCTSYIGDSTIWYVLTCERSEATVHLDIMMEFVPTYLLASGIGTSPMVKNAGCSLYCGGRTIFERFSDATTFYSDWEACTHLHRTLSRIRQLGMKAGVSLNPHTPVELLDDILQEADLVLIMSVNPGFGGQKFIERSMSRISRLREMIDKGGYSTLIEVDGGVGTHNAAELYAAGANVLVAGNAVFKSETANDRAIKNA